MATMKQISAPSSSSRNVPLSLARTSIQSRWSYAGRNLGRSNDRRRPGRCRRRASTCNAQTAWEPRRSGRLPGGLWHFSKFTADDNTVAQKFFQQAIDLDPNFAGGYWGLTWAQIGEASIFRRRNVAETLRSVEALARRAVALDGSDAEARSSLGLTPSNQLACCFTRKECQQWHNPIRLTSQPSGRRIQGSRGFRAYCAGSYLERAARTPRQTRRSMTVGSIRAIGECREAFLPL